MKKLALALVASTVAISAASANIGTGFYLGAHGGYGATSGKVTADVTSTFPALAAIKALGGASSGISNNVGSTTAQIGVMGGYGWVTGCLYFGGEIAYTFENAKVNSTLSIAGTTLNAQLKRNGYFNVAVRGGYLFTPNTMMYVRLGGNWGSWKLTSSLGNASKTRFSFAPGVGLETAVHKNVYVRLEYIADFVQKTHGYGSLVDQGARSGVSYKF